MSRTAETATLALDPTLCHGIAMCAHLAPNIVALDTWNYPIVARGILTGHDLRAARNAVAACPRRALFLESTRQHS